MMGILAFKPQALPNVALCKFHQFLDEVEAAACNACFVHRGEDVEGLLDVSEQVFSGDDAIVEQDQV